MARALEVRETIDAVEADRTERAQRATKTFRAMLPGLSSYAQAVTGDREVRVVMSPTNPPRTDGKRILYKPPLRLGDDNRHARGLCDERGPDHLMLCPACAVREEVLVNIYHEIGHIAFGTFEVTSDRVKRDALAYALTFWEGRDADRLKARIAATPDAYMQSYLGLARTISPYLQYLVNFLEDARVDSAMFEARAGVRPMMQGDTYRVMREGMENAEGEVVAWSEMDPNAQAALGCYLYTCGFTGWEGLLHPQVETHVTDPQLLFHLDRLRAARAVSETYEISFGVLARLRELGYFLLPEEKSQPEPDPEPEEAPDEEVTPEPEAEEDPEPAGEPEPDTESDAGESDSRDDGSDPGGPGGESEVGDQGGDGSDSDDSVPDGTDPVGGEGVGEADPPPRGADESGGGDNSDPTDGSDSDNPTDGSDSDRSDRSDSDRSDGSESDSGVPGGDAADSAEIDGGGANPDVPDPADDQPGSGAGGPADSERGDQGPAGELDVGDGPALGADGGVPEEVPGEPEAGGQDGSDAGGGGEPAAGDDAVHDLGSQADPERADSESEASGDDDTVDSEAQSSEAGGAAEQQPAPADAADQADHEARSAGDLGDLGEGQPGGDAAGDGAGSSPGVQTATQGDPTNHGQTGGAPDRGADEPGEPGDLDQDQGAASDGPALPAPGDPDAAGDQAPAGVPEADQAPTEEVEPLPEYGTPDDLGEVAGEFHPHSHVEPEDAEEQRAVALAVVQGAHFDTASVRVAEVVEHRYDDGEGEAWVKPSKMSDRDRLARGMDLTYDIPESVLGPSLQTLRRVLSDNQNTKYDRNRKSGKVDARVLGRRAWSGDPRLFGKRNVPGRKDYAVVIGVDISSSNNEGGARNLKLAKRAVFAQAELMSRLGINFTVYAHHSGNSQYGGFSLEMYEVKSWSDAWDASAKFRLDELGGTKGNLDGHALEFLRKRLDASQASDKVLLYYSDGKMPAANHDEELEVLQREIKTCTRRGYTLLGVGIRTDSPREHGLPTAQVNTDADLRGVVEHLGRRLTGSAT